MSFFSYSQFGEDMILRALLEADKVDVRKGGFYVDVGAHHPTRFSNTMFFYELGWKGINIDPNEGVKSLFEKERPRDKFYELALGDRPNKRKFFTYDEPALNSLKDRETELSETPYFSTGEKTIEVSTLREILLLNFPNSIPSPNFIDVDVEGYELEVLQGNDWSKYRFSYVMVEQKLKDFESISTCPLTQYLNGFAYKPVARNHLTTIFKDFSQS